jgi:hypothetical protein
MVVFSSVTPTLSAQSQGSPAQGLQISPVLIDLNAEKGRTYTLKITVTNVTVHELLVRPSVNDFKAKDESGNPEILTDGESDTSYSLRRWAVLGGNFILKPKENRVVNVYVNIPQNTEAGGHYGVVRFSAVPADAPDSNVTISASIGTLILARVAGQINEELKVKQLFVEKNGKKGTLFENTPKLVVERFENTGNVHLRPQGIVTIKNIFGKSIFTMDINKQKGSVLPQSIRRFEQSIDKRLFMGRFTIEMNATYGTQGRALLASSTFWVIPFKLIIVFLLLLFLLGIVLKRGLKSYNQRVISKYHQSKQS